MAPIVATGPVPGGKARGNDGAIVAGGELLQARKDRLAANQAWHALDQARAWVGFHAGDQAQQALGAHDAVGVENYEIRIGGAKPFDPVANVARLLAEVGRAPAQIDRDGNLRSELGVNLLFALAFAQLLRVAQNEDVEAIDGIGRRNVSAHRLDRGCHRGCILAIDRKQKGGTRTLGRCRRRQLEGIARALQHERNKPDHGAGRAHGDPGEAGRAQAPKHQLQDGRRFHRQDLVERKGKSRRAHAPEQQESRACRVHALARPRLPATFGPQHLLGHDAGTFLGDNWIQARRHSCHRRRLQSFVHRYSQVSDTGLSLACSTRRNSLVAAPLGSKLNETRKPSISGFTCATGALTAPWLAVTRAKGSSLLEGETKPLKSTTNCWTPALRCGPAIRPARLAYT